MSPYEMRKGGVSCQLGLTQLLSVQSHSSRCQLLRQADNNNQHNPLPSSDPPLLQRFCRLFHAGWRLWRGDSATVVCCFVSELFAELGSVAYDRLGINARLDVPRVPGNVVCILNSLDFHACSGAAIMPLDSRPHHGLVPGNHGCDGAGLGEFRWGPGGRCCAGKERGAGGCPGRMLCRADVQHADWSGACAGYQNHAVVPSAIRSTL
mmetsp:Transcript_1812/g.5274  ORF Transcript_1812/g.5274 Transcript_1812/m.5274 type:complete len:208 (+) Transcript_1812:52-675(+)